MKTLHYGNMILEFTRIEKSMVYGSNIYSIFDGSHQIASIVSDEILRLKKLGGLNLWYVKDVQVK